MDDVSINLHDQLELALATAHEAGQLLVDGFEKEKNIDQKSSEVDWVTEYDRASEELIVNRLLEMNPEHGIVGEEGSRIEGSSGYSWYIDPLDATNNYAHRFPIFAVSIGLYSGEVPLVGVVYDPLRKETFSAVKGEGANLIKPIGEKRLQVSAAKYLKQSLLATGFPYDRHTSVHNNTAEVKAFVESAQGVRRPGCAALDMVYVAAGRIDGYWEYKLFSWDMAAARLIVEESGGRFTHPDGSPLLMQEQLSVLASNGHIHNQMLEVLSRTRSEREIIFGETV
jgi:myo-inositol-1(or 4)-monophosphatase